MKKFKVEIPFIAYLIIEVEAETEDEAIENALDEFSVNSYAGNGGYDKLIGCSNAHSLSFSEMPFQSKMVKIEATEI